MNPGRERSAEDEAQQIINSSDEGVSDLLEGTESYQDLDDDDDGPVPVDGLQGDTEDDDGY